MASLEVRCSSLLFNLLGANDRPVTVSVKFGQCFPGKLRNIARRNLLTVAPSFEVTKSYLRLAEHSAQLVCQLQLHRKQTKTSYIN